MTSTRKNHLPIPAISDAELILDKLKAVRNDNDLLIILIDIVKKEWKSESEKKEPLGKKLKHLHSIEEELNDYRSSENEINIFRILAKMKEFIGITHLLSSETSVLFIQTQEHLFQSVLSSIDSYLEQAENGQDCLHLERRLRDLEGMSYEQYIHLFKSIFSQLKKKSILIQPSIIETVFSKIQTGYNFFKQIPEELVSLKKEIICLLNNKIFIQEIKKKDFWEAETSEAFEKIFEKMELAYNEKQFRFNGMMIFDILEKAKQNKCVNSLIYAYSLLMLNGSKSQEDIQERTLEIFDEAMKYDVLNHRITNYGNTLSIISGSKLPNLEKAIILIQKAISENAVNEDVYYNFFLVLKKSGSIYAFKHEIEKIIVKAREIYSNEKLYESISSRIQSELAAAPMTTSDFVIPSDLPVATGSIAANMVQASDPEKSSLPKKKNEKTEKQPDKKNKSKLPVTQMWRKKKTPPHSAKKTTTSVPNNSRPSNTMNGSFY